MAAAAGPGVVQARKGGKKRKGLAEGVEGGVEKERKRLAAERGSDVGGEREGKEEEHVLEQRPGSGGGLLNLPRVNLNGNVRTSAGKQSGRQSAEELASVKTTFKSALFKLQVGELLKEVAVDYKRLSVVEEALHSAKACMESIQDGVDQAVPVAYANALGVPASKLSFRFSKPSSVSVVGSFMLQTVAKPEANVDLVVEIPKACFHEKDYLNHRYHVKRAMYLQTLSQRLAASNLFEDIKWGTFRGDVRKPLLLLRPKSTNTGATASFVIRVHATVGLNTFDLSKLVPTRNNVRTAKSKDGQALATPNYNASILEDIGQKDHLHWLHCHISSCPALFDAVLLLKVWARQRDFHSRPDSFNGFLLSILVAHLRTPSGGSRVSPQMTPYQIFRVVMDFIANGGQLEKGIYLQQEDGKPNALIAKGRNSMSRAYPVVLCDPLGRLNLAARVTRSALAELKLESAMTLATLADDKVDGFDSIFMTRVDYAAKYDYHVSYVGTSSVSSASTAAPPEGPVDAQRFLDDDSWRREEARVEQLLTRGFGERARLVVVMRRQISTDWTLDKDVPVHGGPIKAGVLLNEPDVAFRLADVGPSADNKAEAKKFRAFWGSKAELRRFKDSTVCETAVWECPPQKRHLIPQSIVEHVLQRHLAAPPGTVLVTSGQLDSALLESGADPMESSPKLLEGFEKLSKSLRTMQNLPLAIVGVQPLNSAFRQSAAFPPKLHPLAMGDATQLMKKNKAISACVEPLEVAIQLEGSGKWPDDPIAIEKTKLAFCLKVARSLEQSEGAYVVASEETVDLFLHGFAFRLRVAYDRDPTFLHRSALEAEGTSAPSLPSNRAIPKGGPETDYVLRVFHGSVLSGLQGAHPLYAPITRLAKRWVACHMFGGALQEEAVELLVASLFSFSAPFSVPRSRISGFLRFLRLLSGYNWDALPLIVDINNTLTASQRQSIHDHFVALRQKVLTQLKNKGTSERLSNGGPAMFIATPYDQDHSVWTQKGPSIESLKRIRAFASSSATLLARLINFEESDKWQSLFCTPLNINDAVILLRMDALPHPGRVLFHPRDLLQMSTSEQKKRSESGELAYIPKAILSAGAHAAQRAVLIGFDPAAIFLRQLKSRFASVADFWHDPIGGAAIGLSWRPHVGEPVTLTPALANLQLPLQKQKEADANADGGELRAVVNVGAVLDDMKTLGLGLVDALYVNPKHS